MKRQAGGGSPGNPADATDVAGGAATGGAGGAGPLAYASVDREAGGAELLEDRSIRISGGGHGRRFGVSVPGAIAGSFLVAALALGAALGPSAGDTNDGSGHSGIAALTEPTDSADGETADGGETADSDETSDGTDGAGEPDGADGTEDGSEDGAESGSEDGTDQPDGAGDGTEDGGETPDATDKPEPTENPAPEAAGLEIGLGLDGTSVVVEWSVCSTDGFVAYKIVRSNDEFVTWPMGAGDSLAGVIESRTTTRFVDKDVDAGRTYHYKVVALRTWGDAKVVACRSTVKAIETPAPKPEPTDGGGDAAIGLTVSIKEGHPFIDWTACEGVDFDYYKVVRSTDSTVTWPKGENDSLVAAIGPDGETKAWDGEAPAGKKVFYRVFCVRSSEAGYVAVGSSAVKGIETPAGEPAPDAKVLGFEIDITGDGAVVTWQGCGVDNFAYYKVVRSTTTENPSYWPWTDGTELIGVVENQETHRLVDSSVESGQTIYYRVQCLGYWNGEKVLRGQTAVIAVTIP